MNLPVLLKSKKGTATVIFAIVLTVLLGFSSVAVDTGIVMVERLKISNAVDAAALAGAREMAVNAENAENVAENYLQKNGVNSGEFDIDVSEADNSISITAQRDVEYLFARLIGFERGRVASMAAARVMPVASVSSGIRPFAVISQPFTFGQTYVLKEGGGDGNAGNYGALSLGNDNGANDYEDNIVKGYDCTLKVGDFVKTKTGNMSGSTISGIEKLLDECEHFPECTYDSYDPDCPRLITVLVVDSLDANGNSEVQIVGFAKFFLEGVGGSGNECEVTGRFIETIVQGELSETGMDYGMRGIKLVN